MAESKESLEQSLKQYELQLRQISDAIFHTDDNSCEDLLSLKNNITELITLTRESLNSHQPETKDDPLVREYELFKAELESENDPQPEDTEADADESIQEELNYLIGSRCQAPFSEEWSSGSLTYHNALIMSIHVEDSLDNIKVKVMFVNPTCREMIPCQYFLDGKCKFSDDQCHFSHGYVVHFADLKEYKVPDFSILKEHVPVLAKDFDCLWKRAIVTAFIPELNQCSVKFDTGRKQEMTVDVHDTLPLTESAPDFSDVTAESEPIEYEVNSTNQHAALVETSEALEPPSLKFGEWEKYTTGIGSRLMASMGYVVGTGLGKRGEGRVEPVVAVALPPGKSLDHCMALREAAGGNPNLFKVDRPQKRLQRRRSKKPIAIPAASKKLDGVFAFMNNSLSGCSKMVSHTAPEAEPLKRFTGRALNVEEVKISEKVDKKNYELMVLRDKLTRQQRNTVGHNTVLKKIREIEKELHGMHTDLQSVCKEKMYRQTMKELTEF